MPLFGFLLDIGHSFSQCHTKEDLLGKDSGKVFVFILKKRSKEEVCPFLPLFISWLWEWSWILEGRREHESKTSSLRMAKQNKSLLDHWEHHYVPELIKFGYISTQAFLLWGCHLTLLKPFEYKIIPTDTQSRMSESKASNSFTQKHHNR